VHLETPLQASFTPQQTTHRERRFKHRIEAFRGVSVHFFCSVVQNSILVLIVVLRITNLLQCASITTLIL
jgi:hypothetical protein